MLAKIGRRCDLSNTAATAAQMASGRGYALSPLLPPPLRVGWRNETRHHEEEEGERVTRSEWKKKKSVEREGEKWIGHFCLLVCFDFVGFASCFSEKA